MILKLIGLDRRPMWIRPDQVVAVMTATEAKPGMITKVVGSMILMEGGAQLMSAEAPEDIVAKLGEIAMHIN